MARRILLAVSVGVAIALGTAAFGLWSAHRAIRAERVPLPTAEVLAAALASRDGPVRVSVVNTASQAMPRSSVLDPDRDPRPDAAYRMSHPSFVLEWADGRILLVDAGMSRTEAASFGRVTALVGGAAPIEVRGSVAERLGPDATRVRAAVFTHLHSDHVDGLRELCTPGGRRIAVFMSEAQDERPNYTTRGGRDLVAATPCADVVRLPGTGALTLPGFPGVAVIRAGGHTPGSQIVVASVGEPGSARRWVFAGDIANAADGIRHDVPKPFLYRLLVVPEDEERLGELRRWLRGLSDEPGTTVLTAHDQIAIEEAGPKDFAAVAAGTTAAGATAAGATASGATAAGAAGQADDGPAGAAVGTATHRAN